MNSRPEHLIAHYVREYLGWWEVLCTKLEKGVYLFSGNTRGVIIFASSKKQARRKLHEFICLAAPRTDKRRLHWVYT